jgi:hypothetical protein
VPTLGHYAFTLVNPQWESVPTQVDVTPVRELDEHLCKHQLIRWLRANGGELRVPGHCGIFLGKERLVLPSVAHGRARLSYGGFIDDRTFERLRVGDETAEARVELCAGELRQGLLRLPPPPSGNDFYVLKVHHRILSTDGQCGGFLLVVPGVS